MIYNVSNKNCNTQRLRKGCDYMQTIAAMNEFQNIIGEDTGWDSEEDMLKDMADFRRGRLSNS